MKGNVFIAWGGNKDLAKLVAAKVQQTGEYITQVGGNSQEQIYIATQIIDQIKRCSMAIILVENNRDIDEHNLLFRYNLMFEWGYLVAKLQPRHIHVFLIGIAQQDLPSDLSGSWTNSVEKKGKNREELAEEITHLFLENSKQETLSPLKVLGNWPEVKNIIRNHSKDPVYSDREIARYILFSMQSVYYHNDLLALIKYVKEIRTEDVILNKVKEIVVSSLGFYLITENQHHSAILSDFDQIIRVLENDFDLRVFDKDLNQWLHIVRFDFLGLCYMFMAASDEVMDEEEQREYLELALENTQKSLQYVEVYQLDQHINDPYCKLWEGYLYRNIAVIGSQLQQTDNLEDHFKKALTARNDIYNYFIANSEDSVLINSLNLEYCLAEIERLKYCPECGKKRSSLNRIKSSLDKMDKQYSLWSFVKREFDLCQGESEH